MTDRYCDYARSLCVVSGVPSNSLFRDVLPLRDFPLKCDPRRRRSQKKAEDIERSRRDLPLLELKTPYKLRRIVVPITRSQPIQQALRIPNARDPRRIATCKRSGYTSWIPTLVENDKVLQEEETCPVLVIDVSEWESKAIKSCYIEIIPHECNVQRVLVEAQNQLISLDDGLLMSPEEAEKRMQLDSDNRNLNDSIIECDSEGELPTQPSANFDSVLEDRPMLDADEVQTTRFDEFDADRKYMTTRRLVDDDDENRITYVADEKPVALPVPRPDDDDIECINLCDDEQLIVPKKESQEVHAQFDRNVCREVLEVVTIDDSDDDDNWDVHLAISISKEESETNRPRSANNPASTCDDSTSLHPDMAMEDLLETQTEARAGEKNTEDHCVQFAETGQAEVNGHCVEPEQQIPVGNDNSVQYLRNIGCDNNSATGSDIIDTVISEMTVAEDNGGDESLEEAQKSVEFGAAALEILVDNAAGSNDNDSDISDVPMQSQCDNMVFVDVHVSLSCHDHDVTAKSNIYEAEVDSEETMQFDDSPAMENSAQKQKRRGNKRKRLDTATDMNIPATILENERRKESDHVAFNDANKISSAIIIRQLSPVFSTRKRKRTSMKKPSKTIYSLLNASTSAISKPSTRIHRSTSFVNFYALNILTKYLKNFTATYECINYFCKNYENLTVYELLRVNHLVKSSNTFWKNRNDHWHCEEKSICIDVTQQGSSFNQLVNIESSSVHMNSQLVKTNEAIGPIDKSVINNRANETCNYLSFNQEKFDNSSLKNSLVVPEISEKSNTGKLQSQRRYSLPMITVPQQNLNARKPREESNDNRIKLTLRRNRFSQNEWIATAGTISLSTSNDGANNTVDQVLIRKKRVTSEDGSFVLNKDYTCLSKVSFKKSCIDKEVPELEINEFENKPLPQKIEFDLSKLSSTLQCRVKKRSTSVDSAIVSDIDDNICKRRKLTDNSTTKEHELNMIIFKNYHETSSFIDNVEEPLEIRELSPDNFIESVRQASKNIGNLSNNNNEDSCKDSESQKSLNLEELPKNSSTFLNQGYSNHNESSAPCLENFNYLQGDTSSDSNSSLHIDDEPDHSTNAIKCYDQNVQIDHNSNVQKDVSIVDKLSDKSLDACQDDRIMIEDLQKQKNVNSNKLSQSLASESNIDPAIEKNIQIDDSDKSHSESSDEKQSNLNISKEAYAKILQLNIKEPGLINAADNNEKCQQKSASGSELNTNTAIEKHKRTETSSNNKNKLESTRDSLENQEKLIISKSLNKLNIHCNDLSRNVGQYQNCADIMKDQALINNENQNLKQTESKTIFESKTILLEDNQHSAIPNSETDSDVSTRNISDCITSKPFIHSQSNKNLDSTNVNSISVQPILSEEEERLKYENNNQVSLKTPEISNTNNSNSTYNQDQVLLETTGLDESLEEGDFDFLASIHKVKTISENDNDDYDMNSDCEIEYENQNIMKYSIHINDLKVDMSLVDDKNVDTGNCETDNSQKDNMESKKKSSICKDNDLHSLHKLPSLYNTCIANVPNKETEISISKRLDTAKFNPDDSFNDNQEDNEIIVEYEKHNNSDISKEIKTDSSKLINNSKFENSTSMQISQISNLNNSDLNLDTNKNLDDRGESQKIVMSTLLMQPNLNNDDTRMNVTVEPIKSKTAICNENVNSLDKFSQVVNSTLNASAVRLSISNDSLLPETFVTKASINKIDTGTTLSVNPTLSEECISQPNKNIKIDFNDPNILQKFNLSREVTAPEDKEAKDPTKFPNNYEEQTLCETLNNMLNKSSEQKYNHSEVLGKQNLNEEMSNIPLRSPLAIKLSLLTDKAQSGNNYDLLKALNVNFDNDVDNITHTLDKDSDKKRSLAGIKVKNLDDMLKKPTTLVTEKVSTKKNTLFNITPPNTSGNSLQDSNDNAAKLHKQPNLPSNMIITNNSIQNTYIVQPPLYIYTSNQPISARSNQPLVNTGTFIPDQIPVTNNIEQIHLPNTTLENPIPMQNNVQVCTQSVNSSDKQIVLASSMFPGMFDSRATSSFCSATVFTLALPILENLILPPPYTLHPSHDQKAVSDKIENYKWDLLYKVMNTLIELENMDMNTIERHIEVLFTRETLTEETWNIHQKILIIGQCVGSFWKLTTEKNYNNIIEAIMGTLHSRVRDKSLLKKLFKVFQKLKKRGIIKDFADEQQPLIVELGEKLKQTVIGMSPGQREILNLQQKIYKEIEKVHKSQHQNNKLIQLNQKKKQDVIQRSSPVALQQNIVTTTVSSSGTDTTNNSLQSLAAVNSQQVEPVSTVIPCRIMKDQCENKKQCDAIQLNSKALARKCDNVNNLCLKCGKESKVCCSKCTIATYCSSDCQKRHWKEEHYRKCDSVNNVT